MGLFCDFRGDHKTTVPEQNQTDSENQGRRQKPKRNPLRKQFIY